MDYALCKCETESTEPLFLHPCQSRPFINPLHGSPQHNARCAARWMICTIPLEPHVCKCLAAPVRSVVEQESKTCCRLMAQPLLRRRSALILVLIIWKLQLHAVRSDVKVWSTTNTEDHLGPLEPNHMASDKARFSCPVGLRRKAGTSSLALCKKTTFKCELRDPSSQVLTTMELPKVDSSPAPMSDLSSPASLPTMSTEKGRLTTRSFTAKKTETITHTSDGVTRLAKPPDRSTTTTPNKSDNRHDIVTKDRSVERTTGENTATESKIPTIMHTQQTSLSGSVDTQGAKFSTYDTKSTTISGYADDSYVHVTTDGTVKWNNTEDDTATTQAPESTGSEAYRHITIGSAIFAIAILLIVVSFAIYRTLGCRPFSCVGHHNAVSNVADTEDDGVIEEEVLL